MVALFKAFTNKLNIRQSRTSLVERVNSKREHLSLIFTLSSKNIINFSNQISTSRSLKTITMQNTESVYQRIGQYRKRSIHPVVVYHAL